MIQFLICINLAVTFIDAVYMWICLGWAIFSLFGVPIAALLVQECPGSRCGHLQVPSAGHLQVLGGLVAGIFRVPELV